MKAREDPSNREDTYERCGHLNHALRRFCLRIEDLLSQKKSVAKSAQYWDCHCGKDHTPPSIKKNVSFAGFIYPPWKARSGGLGRGLTWELSYPGIYENYDLREKGSFHVGRKEKRNERMIPDHQLRKGGLVNAMKRLPGPGLEYQLQHRLECRAD